MKSLSILFTNWQWYICMLHCASNYPLALTALRYGTHVYYR